jgi:hypothetical protein
MNLQDFSRLQRLNTELHETIRDLELEISLMKLDHAAQLLQAAHRISQLEAPAALFTSEPITPTPKLYDVQVLQTRISKQQANLLPVNLAKTNDRYVHFHPLTSDQIQTLLLDKYIPCKITPLRA